MKTYRIVGEIIITDNIDAPNEQEAIKIFEESNKHKNLFGEDVKPIWKSIGRIDEDQSEK